MPKLNKKLYFYLNISVGLALTESCKFPLLISLLFKNTSRIQYHLHGYKNATDIIISRNTKWTRGSTRFIGKFIFEELISFKMLHTNEYFCICPIRRFDVIESGSLDSVGLQSVTAKHELPISATVVAHRNFGISAIQVQ